MSPIPNDTLVVRWNQLALDAISCTSTTPPVAARALAMLHTAMYDAWTAYVDCALSTSTADLLRRPAAERTKLNRREAFSYAAYRVLTDLFWIALGPEEKPMFREFMCELGYDPHITTLDVTRPEGIGNLAARMMIECRYGDGANQLATLHAGAYSDFTNYRPINDATTVTDPGRWQPLLVKGQLQAFLLPHWGVVKPFALASASQFRPTPPHAANVPAFKEQIDKALAISACLTDEQKMIAEYWADGAGTVTPPGHCCQLAQYVSRRDQHSNSQDIRLFFLLANALLDVSIAVWECKRHYDSVRPVTAVRHLYNGQTISAWGGPGKGTVRMLGELWNAYIPTPPFAEYVSGHSTFSAATAYILECYTGKPDLGASVKLEAGSSRIEVGLTPHEDVLLCWDTFADAANQAGLSRQYGGIHFELGDLNGRQLGRQVADCVWKRGTYFLNE